MKRCPDCGREYDSSMMFCLDDGAELLYGPATVNEPATAILHSTADVGEAPTRAQVHTTDQTAISTGIGGAADGHRGFDKRLLVLPVLLAIIVLVGFVGYRYFSSPTSKQIDSIAVMPFINESGNADVEYLADGLTESLINSLSNLPNLSVKARNSVFRYKGTEIDERKIAQDLSVQAVLLGRVTQRGNDLTLHLSLVDAQTGISLWGEQYKRTLSDLVELQTDIARDVSQKLRTRLSSDDEKNLTKNHTENAEANQLYLKGRYFWYKRTPADLVKSRDYFQQAIDLDPTYALAYAGLAGYYGFSAAVGFLPPDENWLKTEAAVDKALALDGSLSDAYNGLAAVKLYYYRDWPAAERAFRRGIELNPNDVEIRRHYSLKLAEFGRFEEALAENQRAIDLDPLSSFSYMNRALTFFVMRQHDNALAQFQKSIELDGNFARAHEWLGYVYEQKGMQREAITAWSKALTLSGEDEQASILERTYAASGFVSAVTVLAQKRLEQAKERTNRGGYVPASEYVTAYMRLGDKEQAFAWLAKLVEERNGDRLELNTSPLYDSLRDDPRFPELLKRAGFPQKDL